MSYYCLDLRSRCVARVQNVAAAAKQSLTVEGSVELLVTSNW